MFNNIAIGQYYPVNSCVHMLDPRVKLAAVFIYIIVLLMVNNPIGYIFVGICLALTIVLSKVPFGFLLKGLKGLAFLIMFTAILNILFTPGERVIYEFYFINITVEGIYHAIKMMTRLFMLIVGSSLLTLTTSPIQLTDAIEFFLKPYKKIGLPAHEIAMMMTIALRFIPILMTEMDKIMKAQMARGADFETGNIMQKAKSLIPILVPLFISAFRRADELALAMEARCYRGDYNRTKMKVLKLKKNDYKAIVIITIFAILVIGTRFISF